jgi:SAM-dependent methyltransferase
MNRDSIKKFIELYSQNINLTRYHLESSENLDSDVIKVIYELQAGEYTENYRNNPEILYKYSSEIANNIRPYVNTDFSILDCGTGESNILLSILEIIPFSQVKAFDISLNRILWAQKNSLEKRLEIDFAVGDMLNIPLANNSVDCILTTHSIEPNGGKETIILNELIRVAGKFLFLVEPNFIDANELQRSRMLNLNYATELEVAIKSSNQVTLLAKKIIDNSVNELNRSAMFVLKKNSFNTDKFHSSWVDPIMLEPFEKKGTLMSTSRGISVPFYQDIPLLRPSDCNFLFTNS